MNSDAMVEKYYGLGGIMEKIEANGPPPIGIHLLMGDNARDKVQNYLRNLSEDRVSVALGMAHKN